MGKRVPEIGNSPTMTYAFREKVALRRQLRAIAYQRECDVSDVLRLFVREGLARYDAGGKPESPTAA